MKITRETAETCFYFYNVTTTRFLRQILRKTKSEYADL